MADQGPKIQIDSDWKAQAQAEKAKLAEKAKEAPKAAGQGGLPPASFETLVNTMVTQALFYLGAIPDPRSGQRIQHLDLARHHIDMLTVIEEKTKGNLTQQEADNLAKAVYELRTAYIQLSSAARNG